MPIYLITDFKKLFNLHTIYVRCLEAHMFAKTTTVTHEMKQEMRKITLNRNTFLDNDQSSYSAKF
jgi:hypothetical protein